MGFNLAFKGLKLVYIFGSGLSLFSPLCHNQKGFVTNQRDGAG